MLWTPWQPAKLKEILGRETLCSSRFRAVDAKRVARVFKRKVEFVFFLGSDCNLSFQFQNT